LTEMVPHSWFESLAIAQPIRRGGHPLQRDSAGSSLRLTQPPLQLLV
jgi:hypothetical protein